MHMLTGMHFKSWLHQALIFLGPLASLLIAVVQEGFGSSDVSRDIVRWRHGPTFGSRRSDRQRCSSDTEVRSPAVFYTMQRPSTLWMPTLCLRDPYWGTRCPDGVVQCRKSEKNQRQRRCDRKGKFRRAQSEGGLPKWWLTFGPYHWQTNWDSENFFSWPRYN